MVRQWFPNVFPKVFTRFSYDSTRKKTSLDQIEVLSRGGSWWRPIFEICLSTSYALIFAPYDFLIFPFCSRVGGWVGGGGLILVEFMQSDHRLGRTICVQDAPPSAHTVRAFMYIYIHLHNSYTILSMYMVSRYCRFSITSVSLLLF